MFLLLYFILRRVVAYRTVIMAMRSVTVSISIYLPMLKCSFSRSWRSVCFSSVNSCT